MTALFMMSFEEAGTTRMKKLDVYLQEIKRQKISVDDLQHAAEILAATPQLPAELENPDLTREKREDLVRSLFPLAVRESSRCWHRIRQ